MLYYTPEAPYPHGGCKLNTDWGKSLEIMLKTFWFIFLNDMRHNCAKQNEYKLQLTFLWLLQNIVFTHL